MGEKQLYITVSILLVIVILPQVYAIQSHMPLLAVMEYNDTMKGGVADLYLELVPGTGRVFIDTFPITKLDTQLSIRFAKEMACDFLDIDCSNFDFFYTIRAKSSFVGGPSAGSAITLLTIASLKDVEFDKSTTITGTINSGGMIGPVGGLKEKIQAASSLGIKTVLIPFGESEYKKDNKTINLIGFGENLSVKVIEVPTLYEAIAIFTNDKIVIPKLADNISVPDFYAETMEVIANQLCYSTKSLIEELSNYTLSEEHQNKTNMAKDLFNQSLEAASKDDFYSSASFCFGANTQLRHVQLLQPNFTKEQLVDKIKLSMELLKKYEKEIDKQELDTITDLQTYIIVKERLQESKDFLTEASKAAKKENISEKLEKAILYDLAYGVERINSGNYWATFFNKPGKKFNINKELLEQSCTQKIAEAEERFHYVNMVVKKGLDNIEKTIDRAHQYLEDNNSILCLSLASKAKAEINVLLGALTISESKIDNFLVVKKQIVKQNILKQIQKGNFPILAYSYYEYAVTLSGGDKLSTLLYLEYAIEFSNLDLYFKEKSRLLVPKDNAISRAVFVAFAIGLLLGVAVTALYIHLVRLVLYKRRTSNSHKNKRIKPSKAKKKR